MPRRRTGNSCCCSLHFEHELNWSVAPRHEPAAGAGREPPPAGSGNCLRCKVMHRVMRGGAGPEQVQLRLTPLAPRSSVKCEAIGVSLPTRRLPRRTSTTSVFVSPRAASRTGMSNCRGPRHGGFTSRRGYRGLRNRPGSPLTLPAAAGLRSPTVVLPGIFHQRIDGSRRVMREVAHVRRPFHDHARAGS